MKLLSNAIELESNFLRLFKQYNSFYWSVAWAGINSPVYNQLCRQKAKIGKIIVGIHFYQTHPDFIETFLDDTNVKFIKQPEGTFHPKVYLFYTSDDTWELIIGSANFTKQAFSLNTEASFLVSSRDPDSMEILSHCLRLINQCWSNGEYFDDEELAAYRIVWNIQKRKLKQLSGASKNARRKPMHQLPFVVMPWAQFIQKINTEHNETLNDRLIALDVAKNLFSANAKFSDMTKGERGFIAGIYNDFAGVGGETWGCFGRMVGNGVFQREVNSNNKNISKALNEIPLYGDVTEEHYFKCVQYFSIPFPGKCVGLLSRLLAMKRPDVFYCITSANKVKFCSGYDIVFSKLDYNTYWSEVIVKITNSQWWLSPVPDNAQEAKISSAKAAFLDAFCYQV